MNSKCKSHPIPLLSEDSVTKDQTTSSYVALEGYFALKAKPTHTHTHTEQRDLILSHAFQSFSLTLRIAKDKNSQIHAAKSLVSVVYRTQKKQEDGLTRMEKHSHYPEPEGPPSLTHHSERTHSEKYFSLWIT